MDWNFYPGFVCVLFSRFVEWLSPAISVFLRMYKVTEQCHTHNNKINLSPIRLLQRHSVQYILLCIFGLVPRDKTQDLLQDIRNFFFPLLCASLRNLLEMVYEYVFTIPRRARKIPSIYIFFYSREFSFVCHWSGFSAKNGPYDDLHFCLLCALSFLGALFNSPTHEQFLRLSSDYYYYSFAFFPNCYS